jgi:hypothetical protein
VRLAALAVEEFERVVVTRRVGLARGRVLGADDDRKVGGERGTFEHMVYLGASRHADQPDRVAARDRLDEGDDAGEERQLPLQQSAVRRGLRLDEPAERLVVQFPLDARVGGAQERHVVHAERAVVVGLGERQPLAPQDILVGFHLQRLVVDDDAVEVKKDGLNH